MSDRPKSPETPDTPDDTGGSSAEGGGAASDDAWESVVDQPARDEPSGGAPHRAAPGLPDLNAVIEALLGGGAGSGAVPDLRAIMDKLLAGAQGDGPGIPDLGALMQRLVGEGAEGQGLADAMRRMGVDPTDSSLLATLGSQLTSALGPQGALAGLDAAKDVARRIVSSGDDRVVSGSVQREVAEAVKVAQLWIDPVTTLDPPNGEGLGWSRSQWVDATMPTWHALVDPVAQGVVRAVVESLKRQVDKLGDLGQLPEGLHPVPGLDISALMRQMQPALERIAGSMFSAQVGHAVGALAADVLSGTEVGLPLLRTQDIVLMPAKIAEFADGVGVDPREVRLYLAVREAARTRLFAAVTWLGPQLEAAVRDYARNIRIDTDAIEESLRSVDISDVSALQEALVAGRMFAPTPTPAQRQALTRLETSLALVEGWVDLVTEQATAAHLPHVEALGEAVRRRRAGGPAEKTFSGLVGLQLRPRRLKDAKNLWAALQDAGGVAFRDAPWEHPDIAPTADDLDDPLGFVEKRRGGTARDEMDTAIDALLAEQAGPGDDEGDPPAADGPHG